MNDIIHIKRYTDYPFIELGDEPNKKAPIRPCYVLFWDGDKYVKVLVEGKFLEVKAGYIYDLPARSGEIKQSNTDNYLVGSVV